MQSSPDTQEVEQEQNGFTVYEIMAIYALTCTKAYVYDLLKCTSRRKTKQPQKKTTLNHLSHLVMRTAC